MRLPELGRVVPIGGLACSLKSLPQSTWLGKVAFHFNCWGIGTVQSDLQKKTMPRNISRKRDRLPFGLQGCWMESSWLNRSHVTQCLRQISTKSEYINWIDDARLIDRTSARLLRDDMFDNAWPYSIWRDISAARRSLRFGSSQARYVFSESLILVAKRHGG